MPYTDVKGNEFKGETFKFENQGDSIEGTLLEIRQITANDKPAIVADLETLDHRPVSFFLSVNLAQKVTEELVGERIKVTYLGYQQGSKGGRPFKSFRVERWVNGDDIPPEPPDPDEIPF